MLQIFMKQVQYKFIHVFQFNLTHMCWVPVSFLVTAVASLHSFLFSQRQWTLDISWIGCITHAKIPGCPAHTILIVYIWKTLYIFDFMLAISGLFNFLFLIHISKIKTKQYYKNKNKWREILWFENCKCTLEAILP